MPVIGHVFVGLATGILTERANRSDVPCRGRGIVPAFWLSAMVALAYFPDIAAEAIGLAGWHNARVLTHSVWFAVGAALGIAPLLAWMALISIRQAFVLSSVCILIHDVLDMFQSTDRLPWWPLVQEPARLGVGLISDDPGWELLGFCAAFVLFLLWRWAARSPTRRIVPPDQRGGAGGWAVWMGRGVIAVVIGAALTTHIMRDQRERQLQEARYRVEGGDYRGGLRLVEQADRWPSTAKPGRADYLRAVAFAGLGVGVQAESYYLRAFEADPTYFWVVVDLAVFYASADRPLGERRRMAAPYVDRLRTQFANRAELPRILGRIERELGNPTEDEDATVREPVGQAVES
jgi:hypothetical protein